MADSNASFIPKNTQRIQKRVRTTYRIYLLSYVSYVFFFGTLIAVLGTYLYTIQVAQNLEATKTALAEARNDVNELEIEKIRNQEMQLLVAKELLNQMTAPSRIFDEIEKIVAQNIRFIGFSYQAMINGNATVSLTGAADTFNEVIHQQELMNESQIFKSAPVLTFDYAGEQSDSANTSGEALTSESDENEEAPVAVLTFTVTNTISPSLIPYEPRPEFSSNTADQNQNSEISNNVVTEVRSETTGSTDTSDQTNTETIEEVATTAEEPQAIGNQ